MKLIVTILLFAVQGSVGYAQHVKVIKYPELLEMIKSDESKGIVIYNFWATWCAPCIKEIPFFEKVNEAENIEVRLISFDDRESIDSRVIPFINRKNIKSAVYLLDETDYNAFIDKIDKNWSGAIPATLIIDHNTNSRRFYEKEFQEGELEKIIHN